MSRGTGLARTSSLERGPGPASQSAKAAAKRPNAHTTFTAPAGRSNRVRPGGNGDAGGVWRKAVLDLWFPGREDDSDEVPCPVSGVDLRLGWHCHHWLRKDVLWSHGIALTPIALPHPRTGEVVEAIAMDHPFIGVPLADVAHMNFEAGALEIPRQKIPFWTWQLACVLDELDPLAGPEWASESLRRTYPVDA